MEISSSSLELIPSGLGFAKHGCLDFAMVQEGSAGMPKVWGTRKRNPWRADLSLGGFITIHFIVGYDPR